jgi:hypothetical protein
MFSCCCFDPPLPGQVQQRRPSLHQHDRLAGIVRLESTKTGNCAQKRSSSLPRTRRRHPCKNNVDINRACRASSHPCTWHKNGQTSVQGERFACRRCPSDGSMVRSQSRKATAAGGGGASRWSINYHSVFLVFGVIVETIAALATWRQRIVSGAICPMLNGHLRFKKIS